MARNTFHLLGCLPSSLRWEISYYDAQWTSFRTFASGVVPIRDLLAHHYSKGLVELKSTPHYQHFTELLAQKNTDERENSATNSYLAYQIGQHGFSPAEASERLCLNQELVAAYLAREKFTILVKPLGGKRWQILDGFHRACLVYASGQEDHVAVQINL